MTEALIPDTDRWNHNIHLFREVVVPALPPGARRVLDVGCGEGLMSRELHRLGVPEVVGLDPDEPSIAMAREQGGGPEYVVGDVLTTTDLEPASFDLAFAVTVLHQTDTEAALRRMAELVRPGGRVAAVGLGRRSWGDIHYDAAGFFATRWHTRGREQWHTPAPKTWPPPLTYRQTRAAVERALPGARWTRHVLFRWSCVWERPAG